MNSIIQVTKELYTVASSIGWQVPLIFVATIVTLLLNGRNEIQKESKGSSEAKWVRLKSWRDK